MNKTTFSLFSEIAATETTGARFASFKYTSKGSNEVARHTIALGINIENAYRRDLVLLKSKLKKLGGIEKIACEEMIQSLEESLTKGIGENSAYSCKGVFVPICRGVKLHKENGEAHIYGFSIKKEIISPGTHKEVKSSEKTLAKNKLRKLLKSGRFRQFAISALSAANMNGKRLEIDEPAPVEIVKETSKKKVPDYIGRLYDIRASEEKYPEDYDANK